MQKKPQQVVVDVPPSAIQARRESTLISSSITGRVDSLEVLDDSSFAVADSYLVLLHNAQVRIEEKFSTALSPAKETLDAAKRTHKAIQDLMNEALQHIQDSQASLRSRMKEYRTLEARRIELERRDRGIQERKAQQELEALQRKEGAAKTEAMRSRIASQREQLELQTAEKLVTRPEAVPVRVAGSTTRTVKKWRVTDIVALTRAALDPASPVPQSILGVDREALDYCFRTGQSAVEKWPGVEVYDDIQIVRR